MCAGCRSAGRAAGLVELRGSVELREADQIVATMVIRGSVGATLAL